MAALAANHKDVKTLRIPFEHIFDFRPNLPHDFLESWLFCRLLQIFNVFAPMFRWAAAVTFEI